MEIESWIMADRFAIAQYLSISVDNFPKKMDEINDPKKFLLDIVKKSRSRKLKEDLIPASGSTAKIGPNYNARLSNFVRNDWDVHEAIKHSESLNRSFKYIQNFQNPR